MSCFASSVPSFSHMGGYSLANRRADNGYLTDHILQSGTFSTVLGYVVQTIVGTTMKRFLLKQSDRETLK